jgi:hypothetical protein
MAILHVNMGKRVKQERHKIKDIISRADAAEKKPSPCTLG